MNWLQGKKGRSIKSRLILILLSIFVPVLAVQAYIYYDSYQTRRASELQTNLEIARALAKGFDSFIKDVLHQELAIGLAITSSQPMASRDVTRVLKTSRDYGAVRDFTWLNTKGVAVYSSNPTMIGVNYSDRSYFREIVNGREWMVSELIIAKTTGEPVFAISRGIRDLQGALLGIVFTAIIPEKLEARLAVERGKGGGHALIDNKGMLVYRNPAINATWEERNWIRQYPEFEEALKGKEITKTVYAPFEEKNRLVGFTPISSIGWAASAGTREEDIIEPFLISIGKSALLFLSILLVALLFAFTASRKITKPVKELCTHAFALGQGEAPEKVKINHVSEFHDLAEAFNTMAEKVRVREMDLIRNERQLREAQELLETVTRGTDVIIAAMDSNFCYTYFNKAYQAEIKRLTGKDINIGMSMIEAFAGMPDQLKIVVEEWQQPLAGEITNKTIEFGDTTRHRRVYHVLHTPIWDGKGNVVGAGEVAHDVTEQKLTEEALRHSLAQLEEANKELESFSYSVSHDLRAPLRAIDGYARSILRKQGYKFDEDTARRFNEIRLNTQMMGKLVDNLLDFSRLGRKNMSMSKMDMEALIGDVWKELQADKTERKINLTVNSMPSGCGDRALIKQVYMNLLSNAVKFTKNQDQALVEVGGRVDGNEDVFYVKDNGVGFDMQYYDKLFGVFQRLHKPDDFEGTGIGLATVHRIINRHGGRVWAESKVNEGAIFYFTLPCIVSIKL